MQQPFYFYGPPPVYGQPTFEQQHGGQHQPFCTPPFYGPPAYSPPTLLPPSCSPPGFQLAVYHQLVYHQLVYHQLVYHQLVYYQLVYHQLVYHQQVYYQPLYHQPLYHQPVYQYGHQEPAYEVQKLPGHSLLRTPSAQKAYNDVARIWEKATHEVNATAQPSQHPRMRHAIDLQPLPAEPTDAGPPQLHL
jgi:hypothetical protein